MTFKCFILSLLTIKELSINNVTNLYGFPQHFSNLVILQLDDCVSLFTLINIIKIEFSYFL